MEAYVSALVLLIAALLLIGLQKTYYFFPARELKRQARSGDREAEQLYRAVAYGGSLRLLLWLAIGLCVAGGYALLTLVAPAWLVFLAVAALIWHGFAWAPHAPVSGPGARLAVGVSPLVAWILYYIHPLLDRIQSFIARHRPVLFHTGLFERDDLLELIKQQRDLADNRISHDELNLALHALSFGDKAAGATMVPKQAVSSVSENDVLGPVLMDELYDSRHSRFPVVNAAGNVVGVLYLRDLVAARSSGTVRELMKPRVCFVHEDQTLYQVLHAFLTTKQHLFVVINSNQTYVGIITIEDVLEQIIGHKIEDDFDSYEDRRAVAEQAGKQAE